MTRTRWILVVVTLLGMIALGGVAVATPFEVQVPTHGSVHGVDSRLAGRDVSAAGPSLHWQPGTTMSDRIDWDFGKTRVTEPSSALLLGLGLVGLAILSGRKFDAPAAGRDSATR